MATNKNLDCTDPFVIRLKKLRKEHNYSFKKLQELTGISSSSLQRYEKGAGANLPLSKISAIANAYNVSPSYLMGWDSKDLPYNSYKIIIPLLEDDGYKIVYHEEDESFTLNSKNSSVKISIEQINSLVITTKSYFQFKLSEIISKPSTTE